MSGAPGWRDWLALTKPGITAMSVLMAAGALGVAPVVPHPLRALGALLGIAVIVGSANAFNMVIEREADALMERTRKRPLPSGRLAAGPSTFFACALGVLALVLLHVFGNLLTAALGLLALILYVGVYTPLKYRTPAALLVGSVPGAMPVLMGWTAATGRIDPFGFGLFLVLLVWQVPHFLAIALFRKGEYRRAGIRVAPLVHGDEVARRETLAWSAALVPVSLAVIPLGAGVAYALAAIGAGTWLLWLAWKGMGPQAGDATARRYFFATLAYLPALVAGLAVDRALA